MNRENFEKPAFLFGDSILVQEEFLFEVECKWLRQVRDVRMFVLKMARSCLLTYLQSISIPLEIEWSLTKNQDGIPIGSFGSRVLTKMVLVNT